MVNVFPVLLGMIATLAGPGPAATPAAPAGTRDASCGDPAAETRRIEEQRETHQRQTLAYLERSYDERLRATLPHRLEALEIGLTRGLEIYAFREAFRKTRECLARARPEPFCRSVLSGDPAGCAVVQAPGGPVHAASCRLFAAVRAGRTRGSMEPCDRQDELAPLCRMIVRGTYDCATLGGNDDDPAMVVCRLLTDPGRCDAPELAEDQGCALLSMILTLRGEPGVCERIPQERFPRLRATCKAVAASATSECLPTSPTTPDLAACAEPEAWTPALLREGDQLRVRAAAANVLSRDVDCVVELRRATAGAEELVATLPLGSIPPGQARIRDRKTTLPGLAADGAALTAHVRCTWEHDPRSLVLRLHTFEHVSLPHPGSGSESESESE